MKMRLGVVGAIVCLFTLVTGCALRRAEWTPAVVARADTKVEVQVDYIEPVANCFPDPDVTVRFADGRVALGDVAYYKNRKPCITEGLIAFGRDGKWGACDADGKVVLPARFDAAFKFHGGLAGVIEGGKGGYIDRKGRWVIAPRFDAQYLGRFVGEVCPVYVGGKGAVIDRRGRYVWEPGLLQSCGLAGGIYIQTKDGKEGFLDDRGKLIPGMEPNRRYYNPAPVLKSEG